MSNKLSNNNLISNSSSNYTSLLNISSSEFLSSIAEHLNSVSTATSPFIIGRANTSTRSETCSEFSS